MLVIGLTGGIGTGKSEAARILNEFGAVVINADQVGHEAYVPHSEVWHQVVNAFGRDILQSNGGIDRKKLSAIIFADSQQRARLNGIMHPPMARVVADRLGRLRAEGVSVVVLEAAVLLEAGWDSLVDEVWATDTPEDEVFRRIQARTAMRDEEIRKRIDSQMPAAERLSKAAVVIDNSGDLVALERMIKSLWNSRVKERIDRA